MDPRFESFQDYVQPFLIDHSHIRGKVVRLGPTVDTILSRHDYPEPVSRLLAELIVLSTMLSSNLKGKGILTVQLKGDGPVKFMVVDASASGAMRGYAEIHPERMAVLMEQHEETHPKFHELVGKGYLVITLDQGKEPYQGIVELKEGGLTPTLQHYFTNSEQTAVLVKTSVGLQTEKRKTSWCAGGIMLQHIPHEGGHRSENSNIVHFDPDAEPSEQWKRACMFTQTVKDLELLDPYLPPQELLYRLFNEDGVWVYESSSVHEACRCSREKIAKALSQFPKEEVVAMAEDDGKIVVNCQFCNNAEDFSLAQLDALYSSPNA
jgi:molecular chaperone Hsp33